MAKAVTKLFRDLGEAKTAVDGLKAKGYKPEEVVVVASAERSKELGGDVKPVSDPDKLQAMGVPEATVDYYKYVVPAGGIVIGVQAEESRLAEAQEILRGVEACECGERACDTSPGFGAAGRMSATNPLDATMSGDFRKF